MPLELEDVFRLGKQEAKEDERTLKAAKLLAGVPVEPLPEFDVDVDDLPQMITHGNRMYANNRLGCCVISGRAHQTLRFELLEGRQIINVTDAEVERQYLSESDGADNGLILLHSLKRWRKEGWIAGGRRRHIFVFAAIDKNDKREIKTAIVNRIGIGIGVRLPPNAVAEFSRGRPWVDTSGPRSGGHYVYVTGYDAAGLTCVTWAQKQHMSWKFFEKYCDEAYAIVDDREDIDESVRSVAQDFLDSL